MIEDKPYQIPVPGGRRWSSGDVKIEYDHSAIMSSLVMAAERVMLKVDRHLNKIPGLSHEDLIMLRKALDDARMVVDG